MATNINELKEKGYAVTNAAGIYPQPKPGSVPLGVSKLGVPMYGNQSLMNLNAPRAGEGTIKGFQELLRPVNAFSEEDHRSLDKLSSGAGNEATIKELTDLSNEPSSNGFAAKLHGHFGVKPSEQSTVSALNLAHTFTKMSPAQKSLGIAAFALQNNLLPGGENIYNKTIVPGSETKPSINTGQFLGLMQKGANPYPLVSKYDQHTTLSTLAGGAPNLDDVAGYASNNNLLGHGLNGAEVPLNEASQKALDSWKHAPQFGPGAIIGTDPSKLPSGYQTAGNINGTTVAAPKGTIPMAQAALQSGLVGTQAGSDGVSTSASQIYKGWGDKPSKDIVGKNGGSALSAGLINMAKTSPFTFSANVGATLLKNQKDIPKDSGDYVSHLGAIALSRLEKGNTSAATDELGVKMATQMKSMSAPEKLQALKLAFTTKGIQSKGDAYQLANQGYGEGRFTDSDLVAMHQVFNNIFDKPSSQGMSQLLSGKNHLAQIWGKLPKEGGNSKAMLIEPKANKAPLSKEEMVAQNQARFNGGG